MVSSWVPALRQPLDSSLDRLREPLIAATSIVKLCYMIQIARLEGFFHVARTGGYARAARAFPYPITQPAIHQQVKKLEAELGTRLLERVAKDRMQLTPAGRHLFAFIAPFFDGLPAVVRALESDTYGGRLHIDAANLVLRDLVPGWVRRIKRRVPHAEIQLREFGGTNVDRLRHGEADLLVSYLPLLPPDMEGKRVAMLHGHIVVPRGHRLASRKRVGLKDLHGETFVAYHPELLAGQLQRHALAEAGAIPDRRYGATFCCAAGRDRRPPATGAATPVVPGAEVGRPRATRTAR